MELLQSGAHLLIRSSQFVQEQLKPVRVRVYPTTEQVLTYNGKRISPQREGAFSVYTLQTQSIDGGPKVTVTSQPITEIPAADEQYPFPPQRTGAPSKAWLIRAGNIADLIGADGSAEASDVMVNFEYIGDTARLYLNGLLVADNFWCKPNWSIWLKRWRKELAKPDAKLVLVISPWKKGQKVFVQEPPHVTDDLTAELLSVRTFVEHTLIFDIIGDR